MKQRLGASTAVSRCFCSPCRFSQSRSIATIRNQNVRTSQMKRNNNIYASGNRHFWFDSLRQPVEPSTEKPQQQEAVISPTYSKTQIQASPDSPFMRYRQKVLEEERKSYESCHRNKYVPFNLNRSLLGFPVSNQWETAEVEAVWIDYTSDYDNEYMKDYLKNQASPTEHQQSLRDFWIASIKLSLTDLGFHRDMLYFLEHLCEEIKEKPYLKKIYFNEDFYECFVGFYFLNKKYLLVKSIHDTIYPLFKPKDILKLVKCCFLAPMFNIDDVSPLATSLLHIHKSLQFEVVGQGMYDAIMPFLYARNVSEPPITSEEELKEEAERKTLGYLAAGSKTASGTCQNFISYGSNDLNRLLFVVDFNLQLLRRSDIPSTTSFLNKVNALLLAYIKNNPVLSLSPDSIPKDHPYQRIIKRLRKTFHNLTANPENIKIINNKLLSFSQDSYRQKNWWDQNLISTMTKFCFYQHTQPTIEQLIFLINAIPSQFVRQSTGFWNAAYKLCYLLKEKSISFSELDSLILRYRFDNKEEFTFDMALESHCQRLWEYKLAYYRSEHKEFEFQKALLPILQDLKSNPKHGRFKQDLIDLQTQNHKNTISLAVIGHLIYGLCQEEKYEETLELIEFVIKNLDETESKRIENGLPKLPQSKQYIDEIYKNFIIGVTLSSLGSEEFMADEENSYELESIDSTSQLFKRALAILSDSENFFVGQFQSIQNYLTFYFAKTGKINKLKSLIQITLKDNADESLTTGTLSSVSTSIYRGALANRRKSKPKEKIENHIQIMWLLLDYINSLSLVKAVTNSTWQTLLKMFGITSSKFSDVENFLFWSVNKLFYSFTYAGNKNVPQENASKLFKEISLMLQADQERLFKAKVAQSTLILLSSGSKKKSSINTAEVSEDTLGAYFESAAATHMFYEKCHMIFSLNIICYLIELGVMYHPETPCVGLELIIKLRNLKLISPEVLQSLAQKIQDTINFCLMSLFYLDTKNVTKKWKNVRSLRTLQQNHLARLKHTELRQRVPVTEKKIMNLEESIDEFERLSKELFKK